MSLSSTVVRMARMVGAIGQGQCPGCRHGYRPGPDCADTSKSNRQVKLRERKQWRREALAELSGADDLGEDFAIWRHESLELARLTFAAQAEAFLAAS